MNAYRKEHSNGKVTYTSNGAYESGKHYTNKSNAGLYLVIFFVLVVAFVMCLLSVSSVGAMANNTLRSEGCHTYNVFGHQDKITNGIDYELCNELDSNGAKANYEHQIAEEIIVKNPNESIHYSVPDNENVPDESPIVENEPTHNDDVPTESLGNPGNDKEVGHAGEHCNQDMCENEDGVSGEHGRSDND